MRRFSRSDGTNFSAYSERNRQEAILGPAKGTAHLEIGHFYLWLRTQMWSKVCALPTELSPIACRFSRLWSTVSRRVPTRPAYRTHAVCVCTHRRSSSCLPRTLDDMIIDRQRRPGKTDTVIAPSPEGRAYRQRRRARNEAMSPCEVAYTL